MHGVSGSLMLVPRLGSKRARPPDGHISMRRSDVNWEKDDMQRGSNGSEV